MITRFLYPSCSLIGHWLPLALLAGVVLTLYGFTLYPIHGGGLDSAEFQIAGKILGITHPTGYPLYCLAGRLIAFLPFGTLALRITLFSTLAMILALVLLAETVRRITGTALIAILAVLLLAVSPPAWNTATIAEVYALHSLFVCTLIILYLNYVTEHTTFSAQRMAFILGLALTHHLMALILLPGLLLAEMLRNRIPTRARIDPAGVIVCFLIPFALLAYFPLRMANGAYSFDLYQFTSIDDYIRFFLGGENPRLLSLDPMGFIEQKFFQGVVFFLEQWGTLPAALTVLGGAGLLRARHPLAPFLLWMLVAHIGLSGIWTAADRDAVILPALISATLLLGYGLSEIITYLEKMTFRPFAGYILLAVLLLAGLINARSAGEAIQRRNQVQDGAFLECVHEVIPSKAVILTAFWERVNLLNYILHSGEYPGKDIHVYRWNDPRAQAGLSEILHYLEGTFPLGYDRLPPGTGRRFYFIDAPADLPPPGPFTFIPVPVIADLGIFELRLNSTLPAPEDGRTAASPGSASQPAAPWKTLTWTWHEPVANQTITGHPLMIQSHVYSMGIGAHAGSSIAFPVPSGAVRFEADVGPSGELPAGSPVSIIFKIRAQDRILIQSPTLRWDSAPFRLGCALQGESEIVVEIDGTEDGLRSDHAIIAGPVFWIPK
ncbi:MAG: protein O-mannosyl-transferase family [bacterium]